jgi:Tol biopolymer transport system component
VLTPDKRLIIFSAPSAEDVGDIFTVSVADGEVKHLIAMAGYQGMPGISGDGKLLTFVSETQHGLPAIWVANIDGSGARRLTNSDFAEDSPVFSADGNHVAFVRRLTREPDNALNNEIYVISTDGSSESRVTTDHFPAVPIRFSQAGDVLYVSSERGCNNISPTVSKGAHVFSVSLSDLETRYLVTVGATSGATALSADESIVLYVDDPKERHAYDVFAVSLDGSNRRQLTQFGGYIGSLKFGFHTDVFTFLLETTRDGTGDIYLFDMARGLPKKVASTSILR